MDKPNGKIHKYGYSDEDFKKRLDNGYPWQEWVAQFLRNHGVEVEVAEYRFRDSIDQIDAFTKYERDLWLPKIEQSIEVKSRSFPFTGWADFPHTDIIVDTLQSYEAKSPPPLAYVIVSQVTGGMIVIPGASRHTWIAKQLVDKQRGVANTFLLASKSSCVSMQWLISAIKLFEFAH